MKEVIILSMSCVGQYVMNRLGMLPYNNPFISTLIPNDNDFVKFINNLSYYIKIEPKLGDPSKKSLFAIQNNSEWYKHPDIKIPYPVIYLDDIEIHCIHEYNNNDVLDKFIRRFNRMKDIIFRENYKIIALYSFSEVMNEHPNPHAFIDSYFEKSNEIIVYKYFICPPRCNKYNNEYNTCIIVHEWENMTADRNESFIYKFNNQLFSTEIFCRNISLD